MVVIKTRHSRLSRYRGDDPLLLMVYVYYLYQQPHWNSLPAWFGLLSWKCWFPVKFHLSKVLALTESFESKSTVKIVVGHIYFMRFELQNVWDVLFMYFRLLCPVVYWLTDWLTVPWYENLLLSCHDIWSLEIVVANICVFALNYQQHKCARLWDLSCSSFSQKGHLQVFSQAITHPNKTVTMLLEWCSTS